MHLRLRSRSDRPEKRRVVRLLSGRTIVFSGRQDIDVPETDAERLLEQRNADGKPIFERVTHEEYDAVVQRELGVQLGFSTWRS